MPKTVKLENYNDLIQFLEIEESNIALDIDGYGILKNLFIELIEREPYEFG